METTRVYIPKWAVILYAALAVILIPWTFNLAENLPTRHLVRHWDVVWVGFDIFMILAYLLTIYFALTKKVWVVISASGLASLFIVDAWFDIFTAKPGKEQKTSILFGSLEVILAILTFRIVFHMVKNSTKQNNISLASKDSSKF